MADSAVTLIFPQFGMLYQTLGPLAEALLRMIVGLALVPHALRNTFGFFSKTGQSLGSVSMLADYLDKQGYRPGKVWAYAISVTQIVCGPLLAFGLFTRLAAVPIFIFLLVSNVERWRVGRYFWNHLGLEYTLMWTIATLFFLMHGGGVYSFDSLIFHREF
jgi:putative oxidoreductase